MDLTPKLGSETVQTLKTFIADYLSQSGAQGYVLGLSGGIDSAVVAKLLVEAVGSDKVAVLLMPSSTTLDEDMKDAQKFAEELNVEIAHIDIEPVLASYKKAMEIELNQMSAGNLMSRIRMCILFAFANQNNLLVAGTSNKSELLTGYYTKYGDGASDILPIGDLYKTQVRMLANEIQIPAKIIAKVPSAGFWAGQSDEEELGITYEELDKILYGLENCLSAQEIHRMTGIEMEKITRVIERVERTWHKRRLGIIPKVGIKTVGVDWRE